MTMNQGRSLEKRGGRFSVTPSFIARFSTEAMVLPSSTASADTTNPGASARSWSSSADVHGLPLLERVMFRTIISPCNTCKAVGRVVADS
jgi:hypothetical protein